MSKYHPSPAQIHHHIKNPLQKKKKKKESIA
jgi:hypothetical protein